MGFRTLGIIWEEEAETGDELGSQGEHGGARSRGLRRDGTEAELSVASSHLEEVLVAPGQRTGKAASPRGVKKAPPLYPWAPK